MTTAPAYAQASMRRLLSILIALSLGFALAAPLFASAGGSSLPECCRRSGRHHCQSGMNRDTGVEKSLSAIAPKCPSYPKAIAAPFPHSFAPADGQGSGVALFVYPASEPQTEARYRVSYARSRQKRGPPVILF